MNLTKAELQKLSDQLKANAARLEKLKTLGTSEQKPIEEPLMSGSERAKFSFGDESTLKKYADEQGFKNAKLQDGKLLVQKGDGLWYRDEGGVLPWIERHVGDIPETVGMVGGGALGTAMTGGTPAALAVTPAMAGSGAAGGVALRQWLADRLGIKTSGDKTEEIANALGSGAIGELTGMGLNKTVPAVARAIPLPEALGGSLAGAANLVKEGAKDAVSYVAGTLSGAGREAYKRLLDRPDEVLSGASNLDAKALAVAEALQERGSQVAEKSNAARNKFAMESGAKVIPTEDLVNRARAAIERGAPTEEGLSQLSPGELDALSRYVDSLTTPNTTVSAMVAGEPSRLYERSAGGLQKLADVLGSEVTPGQWNKNGQIGVKSDKYTQEAKGLYHAIKQKLHALDPNLQAVDAETTQYFRDSKLLNNLTNPAQRENAFRNLGLNKKDAVVQAARRQLTPEAYDPIADTAANYSFDTQPKLGKYLSPRLAMSALLGAGAGGAAYAGGDHEDEAKILAGAALGMNPWFHKYAGGYGSKLATSLGKQALPYVSDKALRSVSPWTLLKNIPMEEEQK